MFRDQSLKPELAGFAEQVRPDFTLLEGIDENAFRSARQ
jgi:hypothetical protein